MLICVVFLYCFLAAGLAWALFFRHRRHQLAAWRPVAFAVRRPALSSAMAAALLVPPLLVAVLIGPSDLPGYGAETTPDEQVAELLRGERLVPPAPLPPLAFTTAEVELVRPMLGSASRNWEQLDPGFSQRLLLAFRIMRERHGYDMALLEGYRSPERQNQLASMGSSVTNARAFQSYHQYGLAADCAFWRDGKLVISEKDPWAMRGYQLYGQVAESLGLTWGGRWKMLDLGHIELRVAGGLPR
jgi:peptidoglycan L-alanyl-D-glutamate endopeptidase CwlK